MDEATFFAALKLLLVVGLPVGWLVLEARLRRRDRGR